MELINSQGTRMNDKALESCMLGDLESLKALLALQKVEHKEKNDPSISTR